MSKIEELKAAFEASTQRKWEVLPTCGLPHVVCPTEDGIDVETIAAGSYTKDAQFIALAHNLMPHLLEMAGLFGELEEHLNWIGWGDKWERECSEDLRKKLEEFHKGELK